MRFLGRNGLKGLLAAALLVVSAAPAFAVPYTIEVRTGNVEYAGTDANVCMRIYGTEGTTAEFQIDDQNDNFERGRLDRFVVNLPDVGTPYRIMIRHDDTGRHSDWFLESVRVINGNGNRSANFTARTWLAHGGLRCAFEDAFRATYPGSYCLRQYFFSDESRRAAQMAREAGRVAADFFRRNR